MTENKNVKLELGAKGDMAAAKISNTFNKGVRTFKDVIAPSQLIEVDDSTLKVGDKYCRNFVIQGYPNQISIGWLDEFYRFKAGDTETFIYLEPTDEKSAVDELTKKITQIEAQLQIETEKGHHRNVTKYQAEIQRLMGERIKIESNQESLYRVAIFVNIFADSLVELNEYCLSFQDRCKTKRMIVLPTSLRMLSGYKSSLPTMDIYFKDKLRNFNTGASVACFPYYDSELSDPDGIYLGTNSFTGTKAHLRMYSEKRCENMNLGIFGATGSGKSYATSLIIMRSLLKGIRHGIVDPEGEYVNLTRQLGGINIEISTDSKHFINFFEIDEEDILDENNIPTGEKIVDVNEKVADLTSLITVMAGELDFEQQSIVTTALKEMYNHQFGINENPESLYEKEKTFDPRTGKVYVSGKLKTMPTLSDFYAYLEKMSQSPKYSRIIPVLNQIHVFTKDGPFHIFDCQSSISLSDLRKAPIINFNVSKLEDGRLRPIGMYIALTFLWEKFIKRDPHIRKRVVADEAWMLIAKGRPGTEFTGQYLETYARRIRKRNAGMLVASQQLSEFEESAHGMAIIKALEYQIFLRQSPADISAMKRSFEISEGAIANVVNAPIGHCIIRSVRTGVSAVDIKPYRFEDELIGLKTTKANKQKK